MKNNTFYTRLATEVKRHRKACKLTQKRLADLAGVGKTVVFDIEHAKPTVKLSTLMDVLSVLNIDIIFSSPLTSKEGRGT